MTLLKQTITHTALKPNLGGTYRVQKLGKFLTPNGNKDETLNKMVKNVATAFRQCYMKSVSRSPFPFKPN